ncbi:hypothetical protein [Paraburkholderia sp. HP33-1]|uniref:hypothetical protein n=1 Tax=Paraburkholderia sp. HP33-1 TaxID=2883243 RepID=UPI001F24CF01|nr:hypothetical protein [Paraburkholderia sp. HP33-1]
MKPLLRVVLILDALVLLASGLLFVLAPWTSLYNALQVVPTEPALVGQAFGVALIGLAWLAVHASFDGAMTSTVAKVVGHVHWLIGVLMLVWLLGLRTPSLPGFGQMVSVLAGVVLVVIGLGGVRLSGAVRRREKEGVVKSSPSKADKRAAKEAGKQAEKDAARQRELERDTAREPRVTAGFPAYHAEPAPEPVVPVNPAAAASVGAAPLHPAEPGATRTEAPDAPRPPFHG